MAVDDKNNSTKEWNWTGVNNTVENDLAHVSGRLGLRADVERQWLGMDTHTAVERTLIAELTADASADGTEMRQRKACDT